MSSFMNDNGQILGMDLDFWARLNMYFDLFLR